MKPIFTLDDINRANAEFWRVKKEEFSKRAQKSPEDIADAVARLENDLARGNPFERVSDIGRDVHCKIDRYHEKQSELAKKPRPRRPELETKILEILTRNKNVKAKVAWHEVKKLPEAEGLSFSAFASLLSRRKRKIAIAG
jgi:acyl-CoA reductase-like NAD-dependent aldehyde dehydrogenase